MNPFAVTRTDFNPHPELPVLVVVATYREAYQMQKTANPKDIFFLAMGHMAAIQARAIFVCVSDAQQHWLAQGLPDADPNRYHEYMQWLPTRLAPGCENQLYRF